MRLRALPRRVADSLRTIASWIRLEVGSAWKPGEKQGRTDDRHVLLLVGAFPPTISGGVYRPLSLARYARENGWGLTVFAESASADTSPIGDGLLAVLPHEVVIERVEHDELRLPPRLALEVDGGFVNALRYVRTVLTTRPGGARVVLASGPPFHTFIAAYFLKSLLGAKLVLDYRDEWSECPFTFVASGQRNRWWEERCLKASDLVIFTTPSMRDHALERFPMLHEARTRIIENGSESLTASTDALPEPEELAPKLDAKCTISFLGTLSDHTDPSSFLSTLQAVLARREDLRHRLRLLWVGQKAPPQEEVLNLLDEYDVCESIAQLSQLDARWIMERSSLLLLIVNSNMDRYRPGKLYSYLATNTPILVYGSEGEAGRMVRQLEAGTVVADSDDKALESALDAAIARPREHLPNALRQSSMRSHVRDVLASRLFAELDELA